MPTPEQTRKQLESNIAYVRARIHTIENGFARVLLEQYQRAYEEMKRDLDNVFAQYVSGAEWSNADYNFGRRTKALLDQINARMTQLNTQVHDALVAEQVRAYRASYYGNAWLLEQAAGVLNLPYLPDESVRAAVLYPYENGTQFFRLEANRRDFINKIQTSIIQSQMQGESIYDAQKRIADALGIEIGRRKLADRLANQGNFYRTEMIARTEILRSSNIGAMAVYDANKDVVKEWEYIATLDGRTCPICGPKDGRHYPLSDNAHLPPTHPNCRCTSAPVTELAARFEQGTRAAQGGPVKNMSYSEWANQNNVGGRDGGLATLPPSKPPKSPGAAPARVAPLKGRGLAIR